jgi:hypothetical protein
LLNNKYYHVPIVYDGSLKTMIDFFIQSGSNPKPYNNQNGLTILATVQPFYQISNCFSKQFSWEYYDSKTLYFINVIVQNRYIIEMS